MWKDGPKKGVKIRELADECGIKPRAVLAAAAELGIRAQNRLTRISPEEAQRLRTHLKEKPPPDR